MALQQAALWQHHQQQLPPPVFLPPDALPLDPLWQGPQLRRQLEQVVDNLELLKAVSLELEVIAALRAEDECVPGQFTEPEDKVLYDGDVKKNYLHKLLSHRVRKISSKLNEAESVAMEAARDIQSSLQTLLAPLEGVVHGTAGWEQLAAAARFRERRMKLKRNRKRRQKKRQEAAEYREKAEERFQQADHQSDEWRAREIAKDIAKRKMEKMKELAEKKAKEERLHLEEELETVLLVEKLQELRALRVQKLKKQGRFFPEEDDQFMERVRAAVEEEERLAAAAADTKAAALAIASAEEAGKLASSSTAEVTVDEGKASIQHEHEHEQRVASPVKELPAQAVTKAKSNVAFGAPEGLPPEFYRYYYGSSTDMGTLIEVRRSWDAFITPGGRSVHIDCEQAKAFVTVSCNSRIPGHWVQPAPPSSDVWASYLVAAPNSENKARKVTEHAAPNSDEQADVEPRKRKHA